MVLEEDDYDLVDPPVIIPDAPRDDCAGHHAHEFHAPDPAKAVGEDQVCYRVVRFKERQGAIQRTASRWTECFEFCNKLVAAWFYVKITCV